MRVIFSSFTSVFEQDLHRVSLINPILKRKKEGRRLNPKGSLLQKYIILSIFICK